MNPGNLDDAGLYLVRNQLLITPNCAGTIPTAAIASLVSTEPVTFQGNGPGGAGNKPIGWWNADIEDNQVDFSGAAFWVPAMNTYGNLTPNDGSGLGGIPNTDLNTGATIPSFIAAAPYAGNHTNYVVPSGVFIQ